ncbi:MAG: hypothetical protein QM730_19275 [Anaerolineales bacterium]
MYIDPNVGGVLFQALAGIATVIMGVLFFFSRQIRSGIAHLRRILTGTSEEKKSE